MGVLPKTQNLNVSTLLTLSVNSVYTLYEKKKKPPCISANNNDSKLLRSSGVGDVSYY